MDMEIGSLVRSKAGHDKGDCFIVVAMEDDYAYIADGKTRKVEHPKRKKLKHLQVSDKISDIIVEKLKGGHIENFEVRNALAELGGNNIG